MNRVHRLLGFLVVVVMTTGCGSIGNVFDGLFGGGDKQTLPPVEGNVKGVATKGALSNADILVYTLDASGNKGTLVTQTTTNANGEWGLDITNTYDLLLIESAGGSYIDESDNEPDMVKKRKITLSANESLYGLIFSGAQTAAINILTNSFYEEIKRETAKSSDLVYTANLVRQKANNTFGFDVFTLLPANPIQPTLSASTQQRYYAMLLGGIANGANTAAIQAGKPYMDYEIISALVKDFVDCTVDGTDEGVDIPIGIAALSKEIDLANETLRFRNNNNAAYSSLASLTVNQSEWCQKGPVATVANFTIPVTNMVTFTPLDYVTDVNVGDSIVLDPGITSLAGATITDNGDGSFLYTAVTGYDGIDQVLYTAKDAFGFKAAGVINIDVTATDTDKDGLTDAQELNLYMTDINLVDSDGDGFIDLHEVRAGTDPNLSSSIPSGTVVGGSINQDTIWNIAGSPYWAQSNVNVNTGATLTIQRGVVVKFDVGTGLNINNGGNLQVSGGANIPEMNVVFTSIEDDAFQGDTSSNSAIAPASGSWTGVNFVGGSLGNVDNTVIDWAGIAVHVVDASPVFTSLDIHSAMTNSVLLESAVGTNNTSFSNLNLYFTSAGAGVLLTGAGGSLAPLFNSTLVSSISAGFPCIDVQAGSPVFDGVTTKVGRYGFSVTGSANATIKNSVISNADEAGIYTNTTGLVDVNGNTIVQNGYGGTQNGGVYFLNSGTGSVIKHNLIRQNNAVSGGGVRIESVNGVLLANNRIIENTASTSGGGVLIWSTAIADIRSNTIVGNQVPAAGDAGGGISSISPLITMTDNILWGNKANAIVDDLNTSFIQSNIIQFNMFEETGTGVNAVANNIPNDEGVNPLFAEGWYLGLSSPAFDTGSTASFPAYITELGTPIADAAGVIDTGTLDKGVHYTIAPIIANANTSSVTPASQATTISTQVTIDITPKDTNGLLLGAGQNVTISGAIYGTVSSVTDLGNGSYLVTFTASALTAEADTLTVNVNGVSLTTQPYISW